jgi:hypothetical protein
MSTQLSAEFSPDWPELSKMSPDSSPPVVPSLMSMDSARTFGPILFFSALFRSLRSGVPPGRLLFAEPT